MIGVSIKKHKYRLEVRIDTSRSHRENLEKTIATPVRIVKVSRSRDRTLRPSRLKELYVFGVFELFADGSHLSSP